MISDIDNCSDGSAFPTSVLYVFECGISGVDLDPTAWSDGLDGPGEGEFVDLVIDEPLALRCWPECLVSGDAVRGDAVRLELSDRGGIGELDGLIVGTIGELLASATITSFREVLRPLFGSCQGDARSAFDGDLSRVMLGCDLFCRRTCCCCLLRSFCDSLGAAVLTLAWSFSFCADMPMDRFDLRLVEV